MRTELPSRLLSWYGDDFTGSTDVLEALAPHLPAVLFLRRPDAQFFEQFREYAAFGLAGSSRSETPEWMDEQLPVAFEWLKGLGAAICHYKVCSTFEQFALGGQYRAGDGDWQARLRVAFCADGDGGSVPAALYGVRQSVCRSRGWDCVSN